METQLNRLESESSLAQKALHDFNNQVFRINLLSRSLRLQIESEQQSGEKISSILGKMELAVLEASETGKGLVNLVRNQSQPKDSLNASGNL